MSKRKLASAVAALAMCSSASAESLPDRRDNLVTCAGYYFAAASIPDNLASATTDFERRAKSVYASLLRLDATYGMSADAARQDVGAMHQRLAPSFLTLDGMKRTFNQHAATCDALVKQIDEAGSPPVGVSKVITSCGASRGYSYNFPSRNLSADDTGFQPDGISEGSTHLLRNGTDFDILFVDALGKKSLRDDGFEIVQVPQPKRGFVMLIAINVHSGITQHYLFQIDESGNGSLVWGSIKGSGGPIVSKSSLMHSNCRKLP
jgi:hypothetical protein